MMDFGQLAKDRAAAQEDKADLFDFYHANFDDLMEYAYGLPQTTYLVVENGYEYNDNYYEPTGETNCLGGYPVRREAQDYCDLLNAQNKGGYGSDFEDLERYKVVEATIRTRTH